MHFEKSRNIRIDFLKGIAIFLVVYGHCIQYAGNGKNNFFHDPVFIFIYSFHMPLFMMISGWVFFYSFYEKSLNGIVSNKFKKLVVPVISWTITFSFFAGLIKYNHNFIESIFNVSIGKIYNGFWFLTALFIISIVFSYIAKKSPKHQLVSLTAFWIILMLTPDTYNLSYIKFMYPYFVLGFYSNKYKKYLQNRNYLMGILAFILLGVTLFFWEDKYYIYTTGMSFYDNNLPDKLFIVAYRYLAGLAGIGLVFFLVSLLPDKFFGDYFSRKLSLIGANSFGTYIITSYLFANLIRRISFPELFVSNWLIYDFIFTFLLAALISIICNIIIHILSKNKLLNKCYLGGR
jgi:fucose 4-O-acetylase-like acetyltransferase